MISELLLTKGKKAGRLTGVHVSPTVLFNVSSPYLGSLSCGKTCKTELGIGRCGRKYF